MNQLRRAAREGVCRGIAVAVVALVLFGTGCSRKPEPLAAQSTPVPTAAPASPGVPQGASPLATAVQPSDAPFGAPPPSAALADGGAPNLPQMSQRGEDERWRAQRAADEIQGYDKDGNGALDEQEYLARYIERHKRRFARLDANRDGQLSPAELLEAERLPMPVPPARGSDSMQPPSPRPRAQD
jgi:hypothetical protein